MNRDTLTLLIICTLFIGVCFNNAQVNVDEHGDPVSPLVLEEENLEETEVEKNIDFDHLYIDQYILIFNSNPTFHHSVDENCLISLISFSDVISRAPPA